MTGEVRAGTHGVSALRRVVVIVMIVALAIAAIAGIFVLLAEELLNEATSKVLATTFTIGLCSIGVLACASIYTRPPSWSGTSARPSSR